MITALVLPGALLLDRWLGEPTRGHPLVGFGHLVTLTESRLRVADATPRRQILAGGLAWLILVAPLTWLTYGIGALLPAWLATLFAVLVLYFSVALRSLQEHGLAVEQPLLAGDLHLARQQVGRIVSRDTAALDETGAASAAVESVLENGSDAVIAPLFWFLVAGAPGVVLHRLANTLDARWGYRNDKYRYFGRVAARADDLLNWFPARLCALLYCLCGDWRNGRQCWRTQGSLTASPNAGVVMAAGAGALGVKLGGPADYHGRREWRPELGCGHRVRVDGRGSDIHRALTLLTQATWLLAGAVLAAALLAVSG